MEFEKEIDTYRRLIIDLLHGVTGIRALKFMYGYLQTHIRHTEKERAILRAQYGDKEQGGTVATPQSDE